jgi:hypothetical protein
VAQSAELVKATKVSWLLAWWLIGTGSGWTCVHPQGRCNAYLLLAMKECLAIGKVAALHGLLDEW